MTHKPRRSLLGQVHIGQRVWPDCHINDLGALAIAIARR